MKKGISLEEVSQKTYIKLHYLQALEEDHYDLLPAPVYTSGYIRQYAKLLGLEGNELVQKYHKQNNTTYAKSQSPAPHLEAREVKVTRDSRLLDDAFQTGEGRGAAIPAALVPAPLVPPPSFPPQNHKAPAISLPGELRQADDEMPAQAHELLEGARHESRLLRYNAEQYADQLLRQLEEEIKKTLSIIKNGRAYLKNRLNSYR